MYGLDYEPDKKDAVLAIQDAEVFINDVKKILE